MAAQEIPARRIEDGPGVAIQRLGIDLGDFTPDRRLAVLFDQLPHIVVQLLQNCVVVAALFGVHHSLLEIEHLGSGNQDALYRCRRAVAVGPEITGDEIAQKVALHQIQVVHARCEPMLTLKFWIRLCLIPTRIQSIALSYVAPAMAGLGADMIGEKEAPLVVNIEVRVSITSRADDGFELTPAAIAKPSAEQLALGGVLGLPLL